VDLYGAQFTVGITYSLSSGAIRYLSPGSNVLVVKNLSAFQQRYGHSCDAMIAGEYSGNLSNSGEEVRLMAADGSIPRDFTYSDSAPWPAAADGDGPSLILRNSSSNPDPSIATNWMASAIPGGLPGGVPPVLTYSTWRALFWDDPVIGTNDLVSGPYADPDGDGMDNLHEYIFGLNPSIPDTWPQPKPAIALVSSENRLVATLRLSAASGDAVVLPQISSDLINWSSGTSSIQLIQTTPAEDGTKICTYADTLGMSSNQVRFIRFQFSALLH
jgi:hypothetical protein